MAIHLKDLKQKEYCESFDILCAKAKDLATNRVEELDILTHLVLHDFMNCRKLRGEGKTSTNIDGKEKSENQRDHKKKTIFTKPCYDRREDLMTRNGEDEQASHVSSVRNDQQRKRKRSPPRCSFRNSEDLDECSKKHIEASSSYSSACTKRKRQRAKDQDGYNYTDAGKAGKIMKLMEVKKPRALRLDAPPPAELPMEFRNKIASLGGSEVKLAIQREITRTDVSDHHDRLNMPLGSLLTDMDVLNEQERAILFVEKRSLKVGVIQPCLEETTLQLVKWDSEGSYSFALRTHWKYVVNKPENNIRVGNIIQVWSFRVDDRGEVWFALVCHGAEYTHHNK